MEPESSQFEPQELTGLNGCSRGCIMVGVVKARNFRGIPVFIRAMKEVAF